jgi:hypothetical protein
MLQSRPCGIRSRLREGFLVRRCRRKCNGPCVFWKVVSAAYSVFHHGEPKKKKKKKDGTYSVKPPYTLSLIFAILFRGLTEITGVSELEILVKVAMLEVRGKYSIKRVSTLPFVSSFQVEEMNVVRRKDALSIS